LTTPKQDLIVKASTRLIEKMAKHPDGWDLVKDLNQRKAEVQMVIQDINWLRSNYCTLKPHL
jgi:hypothetical protein